MEKEFIPYEEALALKELGFDEPCFAIWTKGLSEFESSNISPPRIFSSKFKLDDVQSCSSYVNNQNHFGISAPLYQQAFRWFREKYKLEYHIKSEMIGYYTYIVDRNINKTLSLKNNIFQTYEKAELECLVKLIDIVKKQNLKG